MVQPLRIEVVGESTIHRPAERAVVSITVQSEGSSQEEVSRNVASTTSQLREMLESLAPKDASGHVADNAPVSKWSNSNLSTGSHFMYDNNGEKRTRIYNAITTFQVRFQDFSKLGSFASTLSSMEHVNVDNIDWRLTDKTTESLSAQSRQQAVRDAIKKGDDFAAAVLANRPPITEIRDQGNHSSSVFSMRNVRMQADTTGGGDELSFEPENVALHCSIVVIFEQKA